MTPFRWVLLCLFFTLYLLLGGSVFMVIEQHHEIHQKEELHVLRQDIQEILFRLDRNFYDNATDPDILDALTSAKEGVINRISQVCQLDNLLEGPETTTLKWNYYNSVFFAFTVVTTIGYGHLSPSTSLSKGLMIVYALFGIPLNGILLSGVGDYFSNKLVKVHQKSKDKKYRGKTLTLIFEIIFYLIPGIVVFIIIPAGIFVLIENWTFLDSIYFSFVSLTTIGFGDYVAGMGDGHNIWLWLYKAFIIIWITFGLGYLIMILGFIAKGMKSKKVRGILDKRLSGIRSTKEKLSKDIEYMRRIVNELYLMKLKPSDDDPDREKTNDDVDQSPASIINKLGPRRRKPSCVHFDRRYCSLPRLNQRFVGEQNEAFEGSREALTKLPRVRWGIPKRRLSDSDIATAVRALHLTGSSKHANVDCDSSSQTKFHKTGSFTAEDMLETVVNALSGNMENVMNAVEELNKYEQQVENQRDFGGNDSGPDDGGDDAEQSNGDPPSTDIREGVFFPGELYQVSGSDEKDLLDGFFSSKFEKHSQQLESVVVHRNKASLKDENDLNKSYSAQGQAISQLGPTFMEKIGDALRKFSGTRSISFTTPPETPSRKISGKDSDHKNRNISRKSSANSSRKGSFEAAADIFQHYHQHNSPFNRQRGAGSSTALVQSASTSGPLQMESLQGHHCRNKGGRRSSVTRKISRESQLSTCSYHTIEEILRSARGSRKNTPSSNSVGSACHQHYYQNSYSFHPNPDGSLSEADSQSQVNTVRMPLEPSPSSLVHFLKSLDAVQDRLRKTSSCSDTSFLGSCFSASPQSGKIDLSISFASGGTIRPISGYQLKRSVLPVTGVNRKRKNGIFQPGFSYLNFDYDAEHEEDGVEEEGTKPERGSYRH